MKIKNWSKFQHFKDRRPPWIKLYRDLLDDMQWHQLDPLASKVLVTLWLLASEDQEGFLPDTKTLAWRMRMTEKQILDCISKLSHWLEHADNSVISERYQYDLPETERERETETKNATAIVLPDWIPLETWQEFLAMRKKIKKPPTDKAVELLIAKLKKFKDAGQDVQAILEKSITSNWQDVFEIRENKSFAQQAADVARTTIPAQHTGPDPVLLKIEADRQKAAPMPAHIRQQINQVLRKV